MGDISWLKNYVFVTVGTTLFDDLTIAVDDADFHAFLHKKGYNGIVMQIGVTQYEPKHAYNMADLSTYDTKSKKFHALYFKQAPSIAPYIDSCSLAISHAGSGSITEILEKHKPAVVVVNNKLMHNHQAELANKLDKYVMVSTPSTLVNVITSGLDKYLKERTLFSKMDSSDFAEFLKQKFEGLKSKKDKSKSQKQVKTMIVLGSGGHTAEIFVEMSALDTDLFTPRTYVMASTDVRSQDKIAPFEQKTKDKRYEAKKIPRSRHVGQSYITSIWTTIVAILFCFKLVLAEKPDLIICNGPGTCVPIVVAAFMLRLFKVVGTKILFIESLARVEHLSLTGKILKHFADWFVVQWPGLEKEVGKKPEVLVKNFYFPI